jgi:general secretion pathway protein D
MVYQLENQDPEELAGTLKELIQETIEEEDKEGKIQKTTKNMTEDSITIVPDPKTYSLIVYASQKNQKWIEKLVRKLDEYRPQVLLDVTLVEITKNDAFESEIEFMTKSYGGRTGKYQTDDFSVSRTLDAESIPGGEGLQVFLNSSKTQMILNAIEKNNYGRIMARPKILVNDNEEGEIKTENVTSIAQKSSETQYTESGQAITSTDVSFQNYDSGITLAIKPHISMGDMLSMEITLNRTDFSFAEGKTVDVEGQTYPRPPDLLSTDIETAATVPDGTTIILGGLESIKQDKTTSKIPLLGDIPLIGGLFRGIDNTDEQNRLYVFVKAHIIRPGDQVAGMDDIRDVSEKNRRSFEELEEKFQKMESWPGVKAETMEPEKVLEQD